VCGARPAGDAGMCIGPYANEDAPDEIVALLAGVGSGDDALPTCARLTGLSSESFASDLEALRSRRDVTMHGACGDRHCGQRRCELRVTSPSGPPVTITFEQTGASIAGLHVPALGRVTARGPSDPSRTRSRPGPHRGRRPGRDPGCNA